MNLRVQGHVESGDGNISLKILINLNRSESHLLLSQCIFFFFLFPPSGLAAITA